MCDICIPILGRYARAHEGRPCSLSKSLYCGKCAVHGHSPQRCTKAFPVVPVTMEEATLETDVPVGAAAVFEVTNTDACVRSALSVNGIVPMVCQEVGKKKQRDFIENKRRLMELCKQRGKQLVLVDPPVVRAPAHKSEVTVGNA